MDTNMTDTDMTLSSPTLSTPTDTEILKWIAETPNNIPEILVEHVNDDLFLYEDENREEMSQSYVEMCDQDRLCNVLACT